MADSLMRGAPQFLGQSSMSLEVLVPKPWFTDSKVEDLGLWVGGDGLRVQGFCA